jgi:hypothetical protein
LKVSAFYLGVSWIYHTWDLDPTRAAEGYCWWHFYSSQKVILIKSNIQPVILVIFLL